MFFVIALTAVIAALIGLYFRGAYGYWANKKVPHIRGSFPFGSKPNMLFSFDYLGHNSERIYNELAPHPFGGIYHFTIPKLVIRHPDMIKLVLVKDFSHFKSRASLKNQSTSIIAKNLFSLEGILWKSLRVKLTPTFTSGKLKNMNGIFEDCSRQLVAHLSRQVTSVDGNVINVKDTIAGFTTDVIVSAAFGLESHSIDDPDSPFRKVGRLVVTGKKTIWENVQNLLFEYAPKLRKVWRPKDLKTVERFLLDSIRSTIEYREKNNVKRNDFLNLLIELKKKQSEEANTKLDPDVPEIEMDLPTIVGQCFIFFVAGFETSSSVQTFALYLLATHQDIQDNLRGEIQSVLKRHGGQPTYQAFQEMTYMDQVINETLRMYPTLPIVTRVCTKDYPIPGTDVVIDRGTPVMIPVYALHHDPAYFPDPDKFDPERFSKGNESAIAPYTFLPFGEGPRNCIGMRFGLLQTKFGIFSILTNYKVLPCDETVVPPTLQSSNLLTLTRDAIKLKFQKL